MTLLTVIIPFYKNETQLGKCVSSIEPKKDIEIKVLDDSNLGAGFTRSVNEGLRLWLNAKDRSPYALILNQDCYLKPSAIDRMIEFMNAHSRCALAGIKQLSSENEDFIIHGGTYECFPVGKHESGFVSHGDCNVSKQVPWVNGACMIVRLSAVLEIGMMDENMKMFGSDSDWSYSARARGWECWYIADAVCIHEQGASKILNQSMLKTLEKDMMYFRDKWISGALFRKLSE